jgi:hypothetical protein
MVKRQINQTEIEVTTKEGVDKRVEHTLIVDDSVMPSPDDSVVTIISIFVKAGSKNRDSQ